MSYDEELILRTGQSSKDINYADGWLDVNEPQVVFFQGKRKAGKGVAIANCIEEMHKAGFTILHLWAARNNENWYYALTKHCKATWDEWRRRNNLKPIEEQKDEPLHCNCEKAIPISAMVPKEIYDKMNKNEINRFNGINWSSWVEYEEAYRNYLTSEFIPKEDWVDITQIEKPKNLQPKRPLIKLKPFNIPSGKNEAIFWKQFTDLVLEARKERRIVVMNPMMFEEGNDKFTTIEFILRNIRKLTAKHFKPLSPKDIPNPDVKTRDDMTPLQKGYHKLLLVVGEVKTLSPSSKLSGEKGAGVTKKAMYDMIGEARHWGIWLLSDYQSPEDLFSGVKHMADLFVIKRGTPKLLGDDWSHLFHKDGPILKNREKYFNQYFGKNALSISRANRDWPIVQQLEDTDGYVCIDEENVFLQKFDMVKWHHKHTKDHFSVDFGINLPDELIDNVEDENKLSSSGLSKTKKTGKEKKKIKNLIYEKVDYYRKEKQMNFVQIHEKMLEDFKDEDKSLIIVQTIKPKSLGENYRRWLENEQSNEK